MAVRFKNMGKSLSVSRARYATYVIHNVLANTHKVFRVFYSIKFYPVRSLFLRVGISRAQGTLNSTCTCILQDQVH